VNARGERQAIRYQIVPSAGEQHLDPAVAAAKGPDFLFEELRNRIAKASVEFSDQIQIEDAGICETVQKNLCSRSYRRGRYSIKQEKGVHAFHRMYAEVMNAH